MNKIHITVESRVSSGRVSSSISRMSGGLFWRFPRQISIIGTYILEDNSDFESIREMHESWEGVRLELGKEREGY